MPLSTMYRCIFWQIMNRENDFAGMIIEFDSIRTACELGNRVCATLDFGGMGIQSAAFLAQW